MTSILNNHLKELTTSSSYGSGVIHESEDPKFDFSEVKSSHKHSKNEECDCHRKYDDNTEPVNEALMFEAAQLNNAILSSIAAGSGALNYRRHLKDVVLKK